MARICKNNNNNSNRYHAENILRKPAGRLGKVVFRERSEYRGCGGGARRGGPGIHRALVIRVFFLQFLEGHVLGNFVTVGSDFPGLDSPQVP